MTLAIDFDGVIHDPKNVPKGKRMGQPMPGAVEAITELSKKYFLIIHTVRAAGPEATKAVSDWLDYFKIPRHRITNIKPRADFYIDNNGIRFENWSQVLRELPE